MCCELYVKTIFKVNKKWKECDFERFSNKCCEVSRYVFHSNFPIFFYITYLWIMQNMMPFCVFIKMQEFCSTFTVFFYYIHIFACNLMIRRLKFTLKHLLCFKLFSSPRVEGRIWPWIYLILQRVLTTIVPLSAPWMKLLLFPNHFNSVAFQIISIIVHCTDTLQLLKEFDVEETISDDVCDFKVCVDSGLMMCCGVFSTWSPFSSICII